MSCDILQDGSFTPSTSTPHPYPAPLTAHVPLSSHPKNSIKKEEDFADNWDGDEHVQYQCDISCYGVTAAGDGVTDPGVVLGGDGGDEGRVGRRGGERDTWWSGQSTSAVCFNERGDQCPSKHRENLMEDYERYENEVGGGIGGGRRGERGGGSSSSSSSSSGVCRNEKDAIFSLWPFLPNRRDVNSREEGGFWNDILEGRRGGVGSGRGGGEGGEGDEREALLSLLPIPPHPLDASAREEEGLWDGIGVSRRAFHDIRSQDCGLSDVTSHAPSIDTLTLQEHPVPPGDMSSYRLLSRHSGIQLPVMTIEIEKWLMGLIVNDEEGKKRRRKGKRPKKKKSKQGGTSG